VSSSFAVLCVLRVKSFPTQNPAKIAQNAETKKLRFEATQGREVSALRLTPKNAKFLLVLAHGAGAPMTHPFMQNLAEALAMHDIATVRYNFPYMEDSRHIPDRPPILTATVIAAVQAAQKALPNLPAFAGGKSMTERSKCGNIK
jgi:uncharacterized protein